MSAFHLVPAWKIHSMQARQKASRPHAATPTPQAFPIGDLPFLTRRVLRIIASHPGINVFELDKKADLDKRCALDTPARPHADSLVLHGLVTRETSRYALTHAGLRTLQHSTAADDHQLATQAAAAFHAHQLTGEQHHG